MSMEQQNGVIRSDSLFSKARFGEDTIIGNLDTGNFSSCLFFLPLWIFHLSQVPTTSTRVELGQSNVKNLIVFFLLAHAGDLD